MRKTSRNDILSTQQRSALMARIKGKNTKPEIELRKALFARGLRYRLHSKAVPGRPDIVFPRYRAAVFVNGCFWHGHDCHLFKWPRNNRLFWKKKIEGNRRRDKRVEQQVIEAGWRSLTVWECSIRRVNAQRLDVVASRVVQWLTTNRDQPPLSKS